MAEDAHHRLSFEQGLGQREGGGSSPAPPGSAHDASVTQGGAFPKKAEKTTAGPGRAQQVPSPDPATGAKVDKAASRSRARSLDAHVPNALEALFLSPDGAIMMIGWVDDLLDPLDRLIVAGQGWAISLDASRFARVRRADVESSLNRGIPHSYGYLGMSFNDRAVDVDGPLQVEIILRSGAKMAAKTTGHLLLNEQLRDACLSYLVGASYYGNSQIRATLCLEVGIGAELLSINRSIVSQYSHSPYIERFGSVTGLLEGSIIVCLFGRAEYLFLQCALFAGQPGIDRYEFIFISNSPELAERLLSEAQIAVRIYGLAITVVILSGNAGFGGANNVAAGVARSNRLLIVNPDVFPKDPEWAAKHSEMLLEKPSSQTKIFGASLYYDDGSLMHGGMYFVMDRGVTVENQKNVAWQLLRVEHYGKGAPAGNLFTVSRPVPAVTGAFISCSRKWFEKIGGFSTDYIFGHYEDADLCLKSMEAGVAPWVHELEMYHLEGKGSTRLPVHEGGSLVNRWVFTSRWGAMVSDGLLGPEPSSVSLHSELI